jgi:deoxyribodipyrimidine photo-lyase
MTSIWWIRRDLRLNDNPALYSALQGSGEVIPVFIIDLAFAGQSPRRKGFLYEGLTSLHKDLQTYGSYLVIRTGKPLDVLRQLMQKINAEAIFAEEDYTPYARTRDAMITSQLPLQLIMGQTVHHPEFVKKADGKPYTVFTPYSKVWKSLLAEVHCLPAPKKISTPAGIKSESIPVLESSRLFHASEAEALRRLKYFTNEKISDYDEARNRMDLDGTSALSPYFRFGLLSLRQAVQAAKVSNSKGAEVWLNELIWREFYIQILYHFPHVSKDAFNASLRNIPWRNNPANFDAWKAGRTGMPIVDAAMRQLIETGWMHNRARMIVASFLVKDLLIDWRWGEAWFMQNLIDGDPAANNGGWQWTAGTGTDAAPYFRIFSPVLQSTKFDPHGDYIRRWVPELRGLNEKNIHAPWEKGISVNGYPERPIVDRSIVKDRTMKAYQASKGTS